MVTRRQIEATLAQLNAAENGRPQQTVEETSARLDEVMAAGVSGWRNGVDVADRAAERRAEAMIFTLLADYHRVLDRVIVDPPYAAVSWTMTGTAHGRPATLHGCSTFEFDDDGRVRRYWLHMDSAQFSSLGP